MTHSARIRRMTGTAILSAAAAVLMYLEFPVPLMPPFVKMDFSELPALLAGFAYGPLSGILVCLMKNLFKIVSTQSFGVGELFNFTMGALFVGVASLCYRRRKTRRTAAVGSLLGAVLMALGSVPMNYYIVYPAYATFFPMEQILAMYQAVNPAADGLLSCLLTFNLPFTFIKGISDAALTFVLYKPLSGILHGTKSTSSEAEKDD